MAEHVVPRSEWQQTARKLLAAAGDDHLDVKTTSDGFDVSDELWAKAFPAEDAPAVVKDELELATEDDTPAGDEDAEPTRPADPPAKTPRPRTPKPTEGPS